MKRLIYMLIAAVHRLTVRLCIVRSETEYEVRYHDICGKWLGGAGRVDRQYNDVTKDWDIFPAPIWRALVFVPGGTVEETGFSSLAETDAALVRLARGHLGRRIVVPREWWAPAPKGSSVKQAA